MSLHRCSRRALVLGATTLAALGCAKKAEPLPDHGVLPEFSLSDQNGHMVTRRTLLGRPWVAAFFFTRCPTICPRIMKRLRTLQVRTRDAGTPLQLVSFSVDPAFDTPIVLQEYARRFEADPRTWLFVTGDLDGVQRNAVEGFKMAVEGHVDPSKPEAGLTHGSHLVLVDAESRKRGYYRSDDDAESERLLADLKRLTG